MNTTAFWRLTWKEYRANRAFWLALVVLVVLIEALTAFFARSMPDFRHIVFSWALGAPAFFAVGSAGMAFAAEREEGTIDFLRSIPVSAKQVLASKLTVTAVATAALYLAMWPIALYFTGGKLPDTLDLQGVLRVWLIAALEAIAWGTLCSLFSRRPLWAITTAIFAVSLLGNLLLSLVSRDFASSNLATNSSAATWRIAIAFVVLAVDIDLGLRWLHRDRGQLTNGQTIVANVCEWLRRQSPAKEWANQPIVVEMSASRDRGAMFGHLFWQHWRQSGRSTIALVTMAVLVAATARCGVSEIADRFTVSQLITVVAAAIIGSFVFRADQERQNYRFFIEHNIPPRFVWLSRQSAWLLMLALAMILVWGILAVPADLWPSPFELRFYFRIHAYSVNHLTGFVHSVEPSMTAALVMFAAVCYSAGQWTSMFFRSALIAGVVAVGLALVLCVWSGLVLLLGINPTWSIWPVVVVLLGSTWLRAPDWVLENRRWGARIRAAAALIVPAVVVLSGVAIYRVIQIPLVSPGFDVKQAHFDEDSVAAQSSAAVYSSAAARLRVAGQTDKQFIAANQELLQKLLEASKLPRPTFSKQALGMYLVAPDAINLTNLVIASGRELDREGKFDDAFDRFMAALRVGCQESMPGVGYCEGDQAIHNALSQSIFDEFVNWAAQKGQTPSRIRGGIAQLQTITPNDLWLREQIECWHIIAENRIARAEGLSWPHEQDEESQSAGESSLLRILPWEKNRSLRMLNLLTAAALDRLQTIELRMAAGKAVSDYIEPAYWNVHRNDYFTLEASDAQAAPQSGANEKSGWLATTLPSDLGNIGLIGRRVASQAVQFEDGRRGAMICMALQAYRLEHGSLPQSLDQLKGAYFHEVPRDPYSALPFRYFPKGMPTWDVPDVGDQARYVEAISPGTPGIWSTGSNLRASAVMVNGKEEIRYTFRGGPIPSGTFWQHGLWFPIPEQMKRRSAPARADVACRWNT